MYAPIDTGRSFAMFGLSTLFSRLFYSFAAFTPMGFHSLLEDWIAL